MDSNANKSVVIYFSLSGNTKVAADQFAKMTDADEIPLEPEIAYPSEYQDYVARGEQEKDSNRHPDIKTTISNFSDYDIVYVGFPTWWSQPPMIIHSLFDQFDFSGKTIVPFTTSMSDPIAQSMPVMTQLSQEADAEIIEGFRYDRDDQALAAYLESYQLIN